MKQIYNLNLNVLKNQKEILKKEISQGGPSIKIFKNILIRIKHEIIALKRLMKDGKKI